MNNYFDSEIYFSDIIDYLKSGRYDREFEDKLKSISESIISSFKTSAVKNSWYYQLQLMLNAYLSEVNALTILNAGKYWPEISSHLSTEGYRAAPASTYLFNNIPNNHEVYSAELTKGYLPDKKFFDILGSDNARENRDEYAVEVKATVEAKINNVSNFHDADFVLIYALDSKKLYLKYKKLWEESYSELIELGTENIKAYRLSIRDGRLTVEII